MLKPPDSFYLSAAVGWLELGNLLEANEELEKIRPELKGTSDVLVVRYALFSKTEKWMEAQTVAETLVKMHPQQPDYWCWLAYAERRSPISSIQRAQSTLAQAAILFPKEPTIFFNLACYASQLGQFPEAKKYLDHALDSPQKQSIQKMILDDPDLEPLRKHYNL